ncbi:MAG: BMP family ABC transporter substrate-binding protein [Lachnospiraceae bacterium]|nr:BMP family ABC transporter substrate-binding protein [Lachnospiraceae bacterium]MBQ7636411.1 BMP family ABC transporter substrate-binding protein [Lachnospiraceae bacterium]
MFMKKLLCMILVCAMMLSAAACGSKDSKSDVKIGVILLHDEASTYDLNFINGINDAAKNLGLKDDQVVIRRNIEEGNACYEAAADLVDQGCDIVFADSFGHETYMLKAAKEFKNVEFCHATGTMAHTEKLANFHNAFASIYEGRYLAGVAAGLKLQEMMKANSSIVPKIGYVGAFTYAEVISGYTSFFLGVKSIVPEVTMEVQFTGSWYDEIEEKNAAAALIDNGCVLISQHADSMGAPSICEERKVPNVSYNGSTAAACPNTFIVSSRINWAPYFEYIINQKIKGEAIATDWTGTISTGSVVLTDVNTKAAAADTQKKIDEVKANLLNGSVKVFDTNNFTVKGAKLNEYLADVDTDDAFTPDTNVIKNGYFSESEFRSAPYFDAQIDGITLLNAKY